MRSTLVALLKEFSLYLKSILASPSSVVTQQSLHTFVSAFATPSVAHAGISYTYPFVRSSAHIGHRCRSRAWLQG